MGRTQKGEKIKTQQHDKQNEKRGRIIMIIPLLLGDPHGARTHDPNIKSVVLYQLS